MAPLQHLPLGTPCTPLPCPVAALLSGGSDLSPSWELHGSGSAQPLALHSPVCVLVLAAPVWPVSGVASAL